MSQQTIAGLLTARVTERSDAPLLIDAETGDARSYAETYRQARRWAAFYLAQGLRTGDRVAVVLPNRLDYAELYLGAALAGVTLCPYNPALTDAELAVLVRRFASKLVLAAPNRQAGLSAELELSVVSVGPRGQLPAALPEPAETLPSVRPEDLIVLVMTSGTSGGVKACQLSQASLCWTSAQTAAAFGFDEHSRYLTPLPLFHVNAQVVGLLAAIQAGGAVIIGNRLPAAKLWAAAERCQATAMSSVPAIVYDLLEHEGAPPTSLRFVVCSSAPLPSAVRERFETRFDLPLLVSYGLSEAGCFVSYGEPTAPAGAVGRPQGCEVRIVEGEVVVRGHGLFAGYDGDEAASRIALRDGWLHTGDCGHVDDTGFLHIDGRLKDMINRGGEKIAPDAIEAALRAHPALAEVAVFGVPDERLGEEVAAAIVCRPDMAVDDDELWDFCQDRLGEFETPKHWWHRAELPRGGTGKVLRRVLREEWGRA